jgi:hypothetical protein
MKTATVIIQPGKWTTVSFAVPVVLAPRRGCRSRIQAAAVRWNPCTIAKGKVMKQLSKSLVPPCALCLSLLLSWAGYQAQAQSTPPAKGGELLITMGRPKAPSAEKVAPAKPMSCPKCKSAWTSHPDNSTRGAIKPTVWVEKHLCEGCETTITVAGVGKGKHSVPVHKCTTCGAPNEGCCSTGSTTGGAKGMN